MEVTDALEKINVFVGQMMFNDVNNPERAIHLLNLAADTLEQIVRERDAAVADMERAQSLICQICKNYYQPDPNVRKWACRVFGNWNEIFNDGENLVCGSFKWRGAQETSADLRGLYGKYIITKSDGTPVTDRCFVLKPEKDPAAVAALQAYAAATNDEQLRNDLYAWVGMPVPEPSKPCDTCASNGWDMPQCRECNAENGYKWHRRPV